MNRLLPMAGTLLVAMVLQVAIAPHFAIGGIVPNPLLLLSIAVALLEGPRAGMISGFAAGFAFDLLGSGPIGPTALVLCIVGYVTGSLQANMFAEGWKLPVTVVFIASLVAEVTYALVLAVLGTDIQFFAKFTSVILPSAVYNGLLSLMVFPVLARFLRQDDRVTTFRRIG